MHSAVVDAIEQAKHDGYIQTRWLTYNRTEQNLIPAGVVDKFQISNVADFLWYYLNGSVFQPAGNLIPFPDLLLSLADIKTGWQISDNPLHWTTIAGTGQNPYILPDPRLIEAKTEITMQITNNTITTFTQVNLQFSGMLIFYYGGFTRADLPVL